MKQIIKITGAALAVCAAAAVANAAPVNLGDIISRGGSIILGDKIFADFGFASAHFDASSATVDVTKDSSGTYYLTVQGPFVSVGSGNARDIAFSYTVATTSGQPLIASIDQAFVLSAGGTGGFVLIGETVRSGSYSGPTVAQSTVGHTSGDLNNPAISDLEDPVAEPLTGDQLVISPSLSKVYVTKDIFFSANTGGIIGPTTIIQSFHQNTQVPEGGVTVALLGVALSGLGLLRRRMSA